MFPTGFVVDEDFDEVDALTPGRMDHGRGALRVWIERRTCQKSHAWCAVHDFEVFVANVGEFDRRKINPEQETRLSLHPRNERDQ